LQVPANLDRCRTTVELRSLPVAVSQEFLSSSPERSLPLLVQFGHSAVTETRNRRSRDAAGFLGWRAPEQRERVLATDSFLVAQFTARYKVSTEAGPVSELWQPGTAPTWY